MGSGQYCMDEYLILCMLLVDCWTNSSRASSPAGVSSWSCCWKVPHLPQWGKMSVVIHNWSRLASESVSCRHSLSIGLSNRFFFYMIKSFSFLYLDDISEWLTPCNWVCHTRCLIYTGEQVQSCSIKKIPQEGISEDPLSFHRVRTEMWCLGIFDYAWW